VAVALGHKTLHGSTAVRIFLPKLKSILSNQTQVHLDCQAGVETQWEQPCPKMLAAG
jgi:hypothetical protein